MAPIHPSIHPSVRPSDRLTDQPLPLSLSVCLPVFQSVRGNRTASMHLKERELARMATTIAAIHTGVRVVEWSGRGTHEKKKNQH